MYVTSGLKARSKRHREFSQVIANQEKKLRDAHKPYKPSKWALGMVKAIDKQSDSDGTFHAGGHVISELDKRGAFKGVPKHAQADVDKLLKTNQINEGGFSETK